MAKRKKTLRFYSGIGGQAVLEGVMMRNQENFAVAVRKPDGDIEVDLDVYHGIGAGSLIKKIPFVRGIFIFVDSVIMGMKALNHSTAYYEEEDEAGEPTAFDRALDKLTGGNGEKVIMALTTVLSFAIAIGLFMLLPFFIARLFSRFVRSALLMSVIEGLVRIGLFILYILLISRLKDIKRLFQYHGAEHKCINCIEHGRTLTVENVKRSSRLHRRCGSSFMLFVMLVSIILFFFIRTDSLPMRLLWRILLIPVISGISYELISLAGKTDNALIRALSAPGLMLQRLTTKEPDEEMIAVGIASVEAVFDWKDYLTENFGYSFDD